MTTPRVSVVVPCFNLGAYVTEAVDSVLAQTFDDVEIIVVNDGSTDQQTNDVLRALRRDRTVVLTTPNHGLPAARNCGIARSRGEFVCALDADDRLRPTFLERTIGLLDQDPGLAFASSWVQCFGTEDWVWRQDRCDFPALLAECVVLTASPVRRSAFDAVGGYDATRYLYGCEDWDFWISLVERGYRGAIIPDVLFDYRQREGSMRRISEQREVRQRIWESLLEKHRDTYARYARDVLLLQEATCGRLLRENWDLQFDIETRLQPRVELLGQERESRGTPPSGGPPKTTSATGAENRVDELTRALSLARAEVQALRASASWRVTAPLRSAYDVWLSVRAGYSRRRDHQP
jgi:glycosyltransferase involved in cell wall biosynthesis